MDFCRQLYSDRKGLEFRQGDAENLSRLGYKEEFDLVINVESSHCYGNFANFVRGAASVLKKGGYFLITDFRAASEIKQFETALQIPEFVLIGAILARS